MRKKTRWLITLKNEIYSKKNFYLLILRERYWNLAKERKNKRGSEFYLEENVAKKKTWKIWKWKTHRDWWSGGWSKKGGEDARECPLNLRLPAAANKTLLKRKGSNESIAWSNTTKATKRVEHLINRNSTEGDSQTIFEGTPGRRTWPSNFCSRPAPLPSPPLRFLANLVPTYRIKYSRFIFCYHSICPRLVQYFSRVYGNN